VRSSPTNADLAELLAEAAQLETGNRERALRRAARSAFLWPVEAADLLAEGRSFTELHHVGPFVAEQIRAAIENPVRAERDRDPLRSDFMTMAAVRKILDAEPSWEARLHGDLQMHTHWSDGSGSVADMAEAASARGYEYIAITDHSKGLKIAGGIDERALAEQSAEIEAVNVAGESAGSQLTVLRSIEMNLSPRGEGDMEHEALARLDLVLGAFHSSLRRKEDQTDRYLAALRNPDVQILAHPRGRVYNFRVGLTADWPRVFAEAARLDKAVEIDCYPDRQDLNVQLLNLVRDAGTRVSLGTDAHDATQLDFIQFGLAAALKAGIAPGRIVNFLSLSELKTWVENLRGAAGS
jgi:histidinol phosphatase-like PHP family hydrolase